MTTISGDSVHSLGTCLHKLPAACGLTATPLCCACADKRPHSTTYSVYIDGVGFVQRGVRWERYCWTCKEFWNARVAAARPQILAAETRIPDIPDQSEFLERWFTYHAAHNTARVGTATELSRSPAQEPPNDSRYWGLPRTLIEPLAPSAPQSLSMARQVPRWRQSASIVPLTLPRDRRIRFEEPAFSQRSIQAPAVQPPAQVRAPQVGLDPEQVFRMRENVQQLNSRLELLTSDLQDLRSRIPESNRAIDQSRRLADTMRAVRRRVIEFHYDLQHESHTRNLNIRAYDLNGDRRAILQQRIDEANSNLDQAISSRERAADELEASESEVQASRERTRVLERDLERDVRSIDNLTRLFGSREDIEGQGADYESPIGGMFNRAWGRYREREEERSREEGLQDVLRTEDSYQEADPPHMSNTPEARGPSRGDDLLQEGHNTLLNELRRIEEHSLSGPTSLIESHSSMSLDRSMTPPDQRNQFFDRAAPLFETINDRPSRYAPLDAIRMRSEPESTFAQEYQTRIRDRQNAQENLREARDSMSERIRETRNYRREADNPLLAGLGRTGNPRTTIRHRDLPSEPYGQRRRNPRRRPTSSAGTQAHADEVLNYPPFSGQIQAIDTTNQMLGYRNIMDTYEEVRALDQLRAANYSLDDEDDGYTTEGEGKGLDDENDGRPEAKDREEMTIVLECKICYDQIADIACLPCGHLAMCQWCAEKHIPSQEKDRTRPRRIANCPMCRKRVKQKVKIFSG